MKKYLTVVYTINDADAFESERARLMASMQRSDGLPWAITAMSLDDEMHRGYLMGAAAQSGQAELISVIARHTDIGNVNSLAELKT
ncbi:MAG: hypothetical protein V4532_10245 [Pseudomonadota bacterium]